MAIILRREDVFFLSVVFSEEVLYSRMFFSEKIISGMFYEKVLNPWMFFGRFFSECFFSETVFYSEIFFSVEGDFYLLQPQPILSRTATEVPQTEFPPLS